MRCNRLRLVAGFVLVGCLLLPASALAKTHKVSTRIIGLRGGYSTAHGRTTRTIGGTLVYRKTVGRSGHKHKIDVTLNGGVHLLCRKPSTGRWVKAGWTRTSRGAFHFEVPGGDYRVVYSGTKTASGSKAETAVYEDLLEIHDFGAVRASTITTGGLFVTLSADLQGPQSMITSASPGTASLMVVGKSGWYWLSSQTLTRMGTCEFGMTMPAEKADEVFTARVQFGAVGYFYLTAPLVWGSSYTLPVSATTTFTPGALLP
jgi:hypothetical protein